MVAEKLYSLGFQVVAGCLTSEGLKLMKGKCSVALLCDVTKPEDVKNFAKSTSDLAVRTDSQVWAVVNNAGVWIGGAVDWLSLDLIKKMMDVNYGGTVSVTKSFLPLLKTVKKSRIIKHFIMCGIGVLSIDGSLCRLQTRGGGFRFLSERRTCTLGYLRDEHQPYIHEVGGNRVSVHIYRHDEKSVFLDEYNVRSSYPMIAERIWCHLLAMSLDAPLIQRIRV